MTASLTHPAFWILAALADGRRHGYEIMRATAEASGGGVVLKGTTLYAALERLDRDGLIRADGDEIVGGRARRYYRLTDRGAERLAAEIVLLENVTRTARTRLAPHRFALTSLPAAAL